MALITTVLLPPGLLAARPAFGQAGRLYYATDAVTLTYDTGIAWVTYAPGAGGGGGRTGDDYYGFNIIKNSPGQIPTDGLEPQWWDEGDANATLTDEDTAGEGIPDIHERVFKCVTIANDKYGLQTLTLADEELLDAGVTIVSFGCWVYCATGAKASIAIFGTNLGLQESAQAGAGAWQWLEVNNITLNAGDATIEIRLIVDTDTAWFTMPMFAVGIAAQPWVPRAWNPLVMPRVTQVDTGVTGDIAWSDTDCTANTHPNATAFLVSIKMKEPNGNIYSYAGVGHDDDLTGGADFIALEVMVAVANNAYFNSAGQIHGNDSQVIRYTVEEVDADNDCRFIMYLTGYWRWA